MLRCNNSQFIAIQPDCKDFVATQQLPHRMSLFLHSPASGQSALPRFVGVKWHLLYHRRTPATALDSRHPAPLLDAPHPPASPEIAHPVALQGRHALLAMLGVSFMVMLAAFDQALVGVALPRIVADLQGFALYAWVGSAYLLMAAIAVPIAGRLGDLFGRKRFVLAGICIFLTASVACALADSMLALVFSRAVQGIGGGMLIGTTFATIADIFPDPVQRIRWQAMLSAAFGVANGAGPSLGGYLTEELGWRSTFLVNLPIGLIAFLMVAVYVPRLSGVRDPGARLDWSGALLLSITIGTSLLAVQLGAASGGAGLLTLRFAGVLLLAIGVGALFIRSQRRAAQPILPLHLFQVPAVRLLALASVCLGGAVFILVFYAPLLLQAGFGVSPNTSGLMITPLVAGISVGSLINGRLYGRIARPHLLLAHGCFFLCLAFLAIIALQPGVATVWILSAFGLGGIALGFMWPNLTIQMQAAVQRKHIGIASALVQSSRMLGSLLGVAVAGVLVNTGYRNGVAQVVQGQELPLQLTRIFDDPQILVNIAAQSAARSSAEALGPAAAAALEALFNGARHTLIDAVHGAFWLALAFCVLAFFLTRRLVPARP